MNLDAIEALPIDEYVETLDRPYVLYKSIPKGQLMRASIEDNKREAFSRLSVIEVCEYHADKISVYRSGSGLVNPHEA